MKSAKCFRIRELEINKGLFDNFCKKVSEYRFAVVAVTDNQRKRQRTIYIVQLKCKNCQRPYVCKIKSLQGKK